MIEKNVTGLKKPIPVLTVDGIKDFQVCSLFYDYRFQQELPEIRTREQLLATQFQETFKRVVAFFFYKKMSGATPSYNALLNRWQRLWFPKDMDALDISVAKTHAHKPTLITLSNVAAAGLLRLYDDFALDDAIPILVDENYTVPIIGGSVGEHGVTLSGTIDLILRKGDQYHVYKWMAETRRPAIGKFTLDFAALRKAFEHRNDSVKNVRYFLYDVASTKLGPIEMEPSRSDCDGLDFWAAQIKESEVFYPRRGLTAYCKTCPFDEECKTWSSWKKNQPDGQLTQPAPSVIKTP